MSETVRQIVNRVFRENRRYTGDGLPGEPTSAPLPVGDPKSGPFNPPKGVLRDGLGQVGDDIEAVRFDLNKTYLGPKATAPAVDNNGDALVEGARYFDTSDNKEYIWNGSSWQVVTASSDDVAFTQSGTGAVATTVDEKLKELAPSVSDFGGDDLAAFTAALAAHDAVSLGQKDYQLSAMPAYAGKTLVGNGATINLGAGVSTLAGGLLSIVGEITLAGEDIAAVASTNVSAVDSDGKTFDIDVANASNFVVGRFAFVRGTKAFQGGFRVEAITGNTLTLLGYHSRMATGAVVCTVKPINTVIEITNNDGLQIQGVVPALKNIAIDGQGNEYGLISGSKYSTGTQKHQGIINELNNVVVFNTTRVAIGASMGSAVGINGAAASQCHIGFLAYHSGAMLGTGAFVNNASEDALKCESASAMYFDDWSATVCASQSALGSRYSAFMEMADGYMADVELSFAIAQYNSYLSLRNSSGDQSTNYGLYATDGGHIVTNGNTLTGITTNAVRAIQMSRVEGVGTDTTFEASGAERFIQNSEVNYNGVFYAGRKLTDSFTVGSIPANSRVAFTRTITGMKLADNPVVRFATQKDIPAGTTFVWAHTADDTLRFYFLNLTGSSIAFGDFNYTIEY